MRCAFFAVWVLLSVAGFSFGQGTEKGSDWPRFLGPLGTSVSIEKGIISPWPKTGLKVVWQKETGAGYAAPSIARGRLFVMDRIKDTARLRCLDAKSGKLIWKYEYPTDYRDKYNYNGGARCCPVIDDDRVYIYGPEGMLQCLKFDDGKLVWKVDTVKEFGIVQNFFGVGSTPVIEGDLLIAQVGGSPKGSDKIIDFMKVKGNGSGIVAFDKRTGEVKYKITDELASYSSPVLATINGRRWCFVFARGGLVGFEPKSGKVDFHFPWRADVLESVNASNPVVVDDTVFISETYGPGSALLKVKPGGYKVLWSDKDKNMREKSMQCHWMTPIYKDGYLYGCSGRNKSNGLLRCIDFKTGKVMWSKERLGRTSLLFVDGHFVCLSEMGPMLLIKPEPKKFGYLSFFLPAEKETPLLDYPCWSAPVLSHGLLYVRSESRLVCMELIAARKK